MFLTNTRRRKCVIKQSKITILFGISSRPTRSATKQKVKTHLPCNKYLIGLKHRMWYVMWYETGIPECGMRSSIMIMRLIRGVMTLNNARPGGHK